MEETTNSGLLALVIGALRDAAPNLLDQDYEMPDCALAYAPAGPKQRLLQKALESRGPDFILAMGQRLKITGFDPVLHAILRSPSPVVLLEKLQSFERFTHTSQRTMLVSSGDGYLQMQRISRTLRFPALGENLLLWGVLKALLEEIGCHGVEITLESAQGDLAQIHWSSFIPIMRHDPPAILESRLRERLLVYGANEKLPVAGKVIELICRDISRPWQMANIAGELGLSARSFQRRLREEGTSLTAIIRAIRVREACHLLSGSGLELTEIGYWCGYSDSPHFSREFRRSLGMRPSHYRATAA